jgi:Protein of unknown function (DUF3606)/AbiJ N-terminal domain 4
MSRFFSDRYSYTGPEAPITVREDAPKDFRYAVMQIAEAAGFGAGRIREIVCQVLLIPPDANNWSTPNIQGEIISLLNKCEWFKVYDIAEALWRSLEYDDDAQLLYQNELNRCFREKGTHEDWEIEYWTKKWGVTKQQLLAAVKAVGNSTAKVAAHLGKKP